MVPRTTNPLYIGRKDLGNHLAQAFSYGPSKPLKRNRTFVIHGLGGTGKSEVCLKFAEDHRYGYVRLRARAGTLLTSKATGEFSGLTLTLPPRPSKDTPL